MSDPGKTSATLKWKAEVTFEGTVEQFQTFKTAMERQPITVSMTEFDPGRLRPNSGYASFEYATVFKPEQLDKLTAGQPRMQSAQIGGIAGGIRTPHLHLGDDVVLIDKGRFKTVLGEIARNVFERRVETEEDFYTMIKPIVNM
jgi:hypothetical protein